MIVYDKEINIKVWENRGGLIDETSDRIGHAAASLRMLQGNEIRSNYISWWPASVDLNTHRGFGLSKAATRSASPKASYRDDKDAETSESARERYKRSTAYKTAKEKGEDTYSRIQLLPMAAAQLAYIGDVRTEAQEEFDFAHNLAAKNEWGVINKYLVPYLDDLERAIGQGLSLAEFSRFPDVSSSDFFEERANIGYRGGEINTTADEKINIPGMYSRLCFEASRGGVRLAGVAISDKARERIISRKEEIHEFIPENGIAYWGLNLNGVSDAWEKFLRSQTHGYKFASKSRNCAGVIWEMLQAGGMGCYITTTNQLMWRTPNDIRDNSVALYRHLLILNKMTLRFKKQMVDSGLFNSGESNLVGPARSLDLWGLEDFKRISKSPNKLSFRREQVSKIDDELRKYHLLRWQPDNFNKKLKYLLNMFGYIIDHREKKPGSDRRKGVDALGVQILKLIESGIPERAYSSLDTVIAKANTAFMQRQQINPPGRNVIK